MKIPVLFKDGKKESVSEDMLQFMIATKQVQFFKRASGWVDIGQEKIRRNFAPFDGKDRRRRSMFARVCWY